MAERSQDEVWIRSSSRSVAVAPASASASSGSDGGLGASARDNSDSDDEDEAAVALRRGRRRRGGSASASSSSSSEYPPDASFPVGAASPLPPTAPADIEDLYILRSSRGAQRAIGSYMISTPMGASRHYTLSVGKGEGGGGGGRGCGREVTREREREEEKKQNKKNSPLFLPFSIKKKTGEFCARLAQDAPFAARLAPLRADVAALASGPRWNGKGPFPTSRWTRLLLLQQLLVEAMDLLDPEGARVPVSRRTPLAGVKFAPLIPSSKSSAYSHKLAALMQQRNALLGGVGGGGGIGGSALVAGLAENNEAVKAVLEAMAVANSNSNASTTNNNPFAGLMIGGRGKDGKP